MEIDNKEEIKALKDENSRLRSALHEINAHLAKINELFEELSDIIGERGSAAPATDDEIKDLLKKYSRI